MEVMEDTEDDIKIVVVIGDGDEIIWENENEEMCAPMKVKQEPMDEKEIMEIIAAAEKHGQRVDFEYQLETEYFQEDEFVDATFEQAILNIKREELDGEGYGEAQVLDDFDDIGDGDQNYVPSENEQDSETTQDSDSETGYKPQKKPQNRHAMVPAAQRKSFIDDLRQQYPELMESEKTLIKTVAEIMRNIKPPPPPKEFFIMNGIMYECNICGSISNCIPAAGRHYQEKHGPRYLVCFACGVDFRSKTNLYKHEKRCIAPDAVIMLKARALFLGRKGRSRPYIPHLSTVPQLKPKATRKFPCSQCSAAFTSKVNLVSHEHMHRGERPYWCDKCPRGYTSLSALSRHKQKHSNQEYICDHCLRPFKIKAALAVHMDTHNPVPKFGCPHAECGKRFATKNALNHHVRRQHLRLPMPCACQVCPRRYPRMSLLRDHMKKKHGLALMTRKMFFKALPTLTQEQLEQAKVILKNDGPLINLSADLDRMEPTQPDVQWMGYTS